MRNIKLRLKEIVSILNLVCKNAPFQFLFKLFVVIIIAILRPLNVYFFQNVIDNIVQSEAGATLNSEVLLWLCLFCISTLIVINVNFINNIQNISLKKKFNIKFLNSMLYKYKKIDYSCFENTEVHNIITRMGDNLDKTIIELFLRIIDITSIMVSIIGYIIIFLQVSVWFAIIFFVVLFIVFILEFKAMNKMNTMLYNQTEDERKLNYLQHILSDKHSLLELKIFCSISYILNMWNKKAKEILNVRVKTTISSQKYFALNCLCTIIWISIMLIVLINYYEKDYITLGLFISLIGSASTLLSIIESLSYYISDLSQNLLCIDYYNKFINLPEDHKYNEKEYDFEKPEIVFKNVSFTYPGTTQKILDNISFSINYNEKVALVGKNGSGKTTIIKLLCKLYKPDSGEILVGGININNIDRNSLAKIYSVVFQDYANYALTLRENIAVGDIKKLNNDDSIIKSLTFGLKNMNISLDQNLGKIDENGMDLSKGQWQQVAIARARIVENNFIVLDEPTASLDPIAECELYNSFLEVLNDRGCIIISHRLASAKLCDKIIVIHGGQIVEVGTHTELLKHKNIYCNMFKTQSEWYSKGEKYEKNKNC
ncbi:ABC transporter ATP-binding protein [Sedimentibacter sp. zth1]|uniref:ABC transporter ATP-binding protein n=1 Tax=Sedimentibacter sp. zth1 TaxID=2816908 RepID=UPI001A910260|nr:ABC transporter ATP-binding protein [Sedimentibacter sp. zth1]QSX05250.1 ABC transporter ATP-binding protein [Sedimentibacter sp. zth1]